MIGAKFNDGDAVYEVVAADGGAWIVTRVDTHEGPRRMTSAEIAERFTPDDDVSDPTQPSEREGWEALADANDRAALRLAYMQHPEDFEPDEGTPEHDAWQHAVRAARGECKPTPEDHFTRVSAEQAKRLGQKR